MRIAFVDTLYFVALFNPRDQWHDRATAASKLLAETKLITTEDVLVELLNFFSEYGEKARRGAVAQAEGILNDANIEVIRQSHDTFIGWSLALQSAARQGLQPDGLYIDAYHAGTKHQRHIDA